MNDYKITEKLKRLSNEIKDLQYDVNYIIKNGLEDTIEKELEYFKNKFNKIEEVIKQFKEKR